MTPRQAPEPGEVHVWQASLAVDEGCLERLRQFLSSEEMTRGNRLLDPLKRRRFFAGRGIVREILSSYLGTSPANVPIGITPSGKPFLAMDAMDSMDAMDPNVPSLSRGGTGWGSVSSLRFNLSHSNDLLLLAITVGLEVGIDVEHVRDDLDFAPLARTCFSAAERAELLSLPAHLQRAAFYRCWTRKEAYLKGTGTGFSRSCDLVEVTLLPGAPAAIVLHQEDAANCAAWQLGDLSAPAGYCAALAVAGHSAAVSYFTYSD